MTLKQLINNSDLRELALPSNITYGTAIYERGAVEVINQSDRHIEAWAGGLDGSVKEGGGSRRRVKLMVEKGELHWHCSGNPKVHDIFCKHCVAITMLLQNDPSL